MNWVFFVGVLMLRALLPRVLGGSKKWNLGWMHFLDRPRALGLGLYGSLPLGALLLSNRHIEPTDF